MNHRNESAAAAGLRAVVFDCDGVLFDSAAANIAFFDDVLAAAGLAPLDARGRQLAQSMTTHQLVDVLFADPVTRARVTAEARELDYGPYFALMRPVDGLHDTLAALRRDFRTGMATNRGKTVHEVIRRFGLTPYFDVALGILDVERPKPHPDMLEACLARLGVAAGEAVYVGDQETDRRAAAAAGMRFVAVGDQTAGDVGITTLAELPAALATLAPPAPGRSATATAASGR